MSKQTAQQPTQTSHMNQTPSERFKAAVSQVLTTSKSSLPKSSKKK